MERVKEILERLEETTSKIQNEEHAQALSPRIRRMLKKLMEAEMTIDTMKATLAPKVVKNLKKKWLKQNQEMAVEIISQWKHLFRSAKQQKSASASSPAKARAPTPAKISAAAVDTASPKRAKKSSTAKKPSHSPNRRGAVPVVSSSPPQTSPSAQPKSKWVMSCVPKKKKRPAPSRSRSPMSRNMHGKKPLLKPRMKRGLSSGSSGSEALDPRHKTVRKVSLSDFIPEPKEQRKAYKVGSLQSLCTKALEVYVHKLTCLGPEHVRLPSPLLRRILGRCTPERLAMLEAKNPYIKDDTNGIWKRHCQEKFRTTQLPEGSTWRRHYQEETEKKQKFIANAIEKLNRKTAERQRERKYRMESMKVKSLELEKRRKRTGGEKGNVFRLSPNNRKRNRSPSSDKRRMAKAKLSKILHGH